MIRTLLLSCCLLLLFAGPAMAEQPASTTVEGALQGYFSQDTEDPAAAVLVESGFAYERMLVAERLPSGASFFVEVELRRDELRFRYPVKLEREGQGDEASWRVEWAPEDEYARALVAMGDIEMLADIEADEPWADIQRLPALPVLVADQAIVTPFGHVSEPPSGSEAADGQLVPPEELVKHAQNWTGLALEDEPGTANADLVIAAGTSWRRVTQALMGPAAVGLFRSYMVGGADGALVALPGVAPVVDGELAEGVEPLVVGMYPADDGHAFRVRVGDRLIENEDACAERMTLCAESAGPFGRQIGEQISAALEEQPAKIGYVMFAATGDLPVEEVASHLRALGDTLGVPPEKLRVGFIAEEESE